MRQARFVVIAAMFLTLATPSIGSADSRIDTLGPEALAQTTASRVSAAGRSVDDVDTIYRLYVAYFDRVPDASGLWFWIDQYRAGASLASISDQFAMSPEFNTRYGSMNDAAFVALVYESVLDRAADPDGLTHWQSEMARGMTRGALMIQFSESLEFKITTGFLNVAEIQRLYRAAFLRSLTHRWGGVLGVPRNWKPSMCNDEGLYRAGGYVGEGVAATNLAGRTIADLIAGDNTELTRLPWVRPPSRKWPFEPFRWAGIMLGAELFERADRRETKTGQPAKEAGLVWSLLRR